MRGVDRLLGGLLGVCLIIGMLVQPAGAAPTSMASNGIVTPPAGHRYRYYRPPYGAVDANTDAYADALGYKVVGWDLDPKDWRRPGADAISSLVIQRAFPGAIVVLHDGGGGSQQTVAAVETILEELSGQGYVFRALP